MKAENNWVNVPHQAISHSKSIDKSGVKIRIMTSPQDVPEMWRCFMEKSPDTEMVFVLELRYLTSEEPLRFFEKKGIRVEVGKNSKRVYRIAIPHSLLSGAQDSISVNLEKIIKAWGDEGALRSAHSDVIQGMLDMKRFKKAMQDSMLES